MKILIGTPIHSSKDYCLARWLQNVFKLKHLGRLLLVDNSFGLAYTEKVREYCKKKGLKDFKVVHIELPEEIKFFERVARSREIIRQYVLANDYDAWFSWECDQIIPEDALDKLVEIMQSGDFSIVSHNNLTRQNPELPNFDFGVALISKKALSKHSFLLEFGSDPKMPKTWEPGEMWFRERVLRDGGKIIEADGVIKPIYHLDE